MILLQNWSMKLCGDPYTPPELCVERLTGQVYGHPSQPDGKWCHTTRIIEVKGRIVTTRSGHVSRLGKIDRGYRRYLRQTRPDWDWRNPITMVD